MQRKTSELPVVIETARCLSSALEKTMKNLKPLLLVMAVVSFALASYEIRQTMKSTVVLSPSSSIRTANNGCMARDSHDRDSRETGRSLGIYIHDDGLRETGSGDHARDSDLRDIRSDDHGCDHNLQNASR